MVQFTYFASNIIFHVAIMSIFLTIFFFTIAKTVEKQIVERQVSLLIDDFTTNLVPAIPEDMHDILISKLKIDSDQFKNDDQTVVNMNDSTLKKALIGSGIIAGIALIIILILWLIENKYFKNPWKNGILGLIKDNVVALIFIAVAETAFLLLIARNYYSVDPNAIKLKIIDTIHNSN